jgi:hypothetical protein
MTYRIRPMARPGRWPLSALAGTGIPTWRIEVDGAAIRKATPQGRCGPTTSYCSDDW